jgi:predicted XRE-type DNA-binding protein
MESNKDLIKRIKKAESNKKNLTHITDKSDLSLEDKMKISLCKFFVQFAHTKKMKMSTLSQLTEIPKTRLSEITNYKIQNFKVSQLLKYLSVLAEHDSHVKNHVELLVQAFALPMLKASETKKLTKSIKASSQYSYA